MSLLKDDNNYAECFSWIGIALITPFKEDFSIDYEALENLVNYH